MNQGSLRPFNHPGSYRSIMPFRSMLIQKLLVMNTSIDNLGLSNHADSGVLSKYYELYRKY